MNALSDNDHNLCQRAILKIDMNTLAAILHKNVSIFQSNLSNSISQEKGQEFLKQAMKAIIKNIQLRLNSLLEE